jgi:hypothetical protein
MSTDTSVPEFTVGWEFVGLRDTTVFFRHVSAILGPDAALVLEESSMARDVRSFVEAHSAKPLGRIRPGTLWPRSRWHWLPTSSEVLDGLARLSERHAEPEMCDHLYAVSDGCLVVAWHDAFDGPLVVSSGISEERVRHFGRAVGITPSRWQAA